jgi:hypothetical protein
MWSPPGSVARPCSPSAPRPGGGIVGRGRVIVDGGRYDYLTDVVVVSAHQHRGPGSRIGAVLTASVESVPFENTRVGLFSVGGTAEFYTRFATRPSGQAVRRCIAG